MNNDHFSTTTSDDEVSASAPCLSGGEVPGSRRVALKAFFRSLSMYSSFSHHGMQNIGFAFSIFPFAKRMEDKRDRISALSAGHMQLFNTHPYLSGPIIGSVLHMEETSAVSSLVLALQRTLLVPLAFFIIQFIQSTSHVDQKMGFCGRLSPKERRASIIPDFPLFLGDKERNLPGGNALLHVCYKLFGLPLIWWK